jgi:hypothetical protein
MLSRRSLGQDGCRFGMAVIVVTLPFHDNDHFVAPVMTGGRQFNATSRGEEKHYIHDALRNL